MLKVRIDSRDLIFAQRIFWQKPHQSPGFNVLPDAEGWENGETKAGEQNVADRPVICNGDLDIQLRRIGPRAPREVVDGVLGRPRVDDGRVCRKVFEAKAAVQPRRKRRTCAKYPTEICDLPDHGRGAAHRRDAHAQIEPALVQLKRRLGARRQFKIYPDGRVRNAKCGGGLRKMPLAERTHGENPQHALVLRVDVNEPRFVRAHHAKHMLAGLQIASPGLRQAHLARRAIKQADAKLLFKIGDIAAHLAAGNTQAAGSGGETQVRSGFYERFDRLEFVHGVLSH